MKIAFLIAAHHQPYHLEKMVKRLNSSSVTFFIHIDKKTNIEQFTRTSLNNYSNVIFLPKNERIAVTWGGISQVFATINLLKHALQLNFPFNRYCLLSGADFPIKNNDEIINKFETKKEFLRVDRKLTASNDNSHCKFVNYFWFRELPRLPRYILSGKMRRKLDNKVDLYHGSNWWALTEECVKFIMNFLNENKDYLNFHRYTLCPDEIFFHSIIKSSPYAVNISHDFEQCSNLNDFLVSNDRGVHYIDWTTKGPKVLNKGDLDLLFNSDALFARKFCEIKSRDLIFQLEEILNGERDGFAH